MIQTFVLVRKFLRTEKNLMSCSIIFSLLYGFLYSFFHIEPLSIQNFALLTWINILFALFLVAQDIYVSDLKDGFLEFLLSEKMSLHKIFISKVLYIYIGYFLPVLGVTFLNGLLYDQSIDQIVRVLLSVFVMGPSLIFLIHTGSLFTIHSLGNAFLIPIIMIPFFIPPLIFGMSMSIQLYDDRHFTSLLFGGIGLDLVYGIMSVIFTQYLLEDGFK